MGTGVIMGIRFYCPNGHKLNVKDFQAGQTGICPHCGSKMPIPLQSTRPSSRKEKRRGKRRTTPATPPDAPAGAPAAGAGRGGMPAFAAPPAAAAAGAGLADPLAAAGNVVWYVRPASGGQFGPATADVMRSWLIEGRVATDTLVWREGWREWLEAGRIFPQLSPEPMIPGMEGVFSQPITIPGHSHPVKHEEEPRSTLAIAIGAAAIIVAALVVVLLVILMK
jgi:hypothetical protein